MVLAKATTPRAGLRGGAIGRRPVGPRIRTAIFVPVLALVLTACAAENAVENSDPADASQEALRSGEVPRDELRARDVAHEAGIAGTVRTIGQNCIADIDGDGEDDLVLSIHDEAPWQVFLGQGDGTFVEAYAETFPTKDRHGCAVADFTGDGRLDIYFSLGACVGECPNPPTKELWVQRDEGDFVEVAAEWGITDPFQRGRQPLAFDATGDGRPDLFTGAETGNDYPSPNRLYINDGDRFVEHESLPSEEIGNYCSVAGDVTGNGFEDLVVCGSPDHGFRFYENERGEFREVADEIALPTSWASDAALADLAGNGSLDLVIVRHHQLEVWSNVDGRFPEMSYRHPLERGKAVAIGDVTGDGALDLYVVQRFNADNPDVLLLNDGDGRSFTVWDHLPRITEGDGDTAQAIEDWKGTGRAAILVNNGFGPTHGPRVLFEFD